MGKVYVGAAGKAREAKKIYVGVGGKARLVTKAYVGVDGKARQIWPPGERLGGFAVGASLYMLEDNGSPAEYILCAHNFDTSKLASWPRMSVLIRKDIYSMTTHASLAAAQNNFTDMLASRNAGFANIATAALPTLTMLGLTLSGYTNQYGGTILSNAASIRAALYSGTRTAYWLLDVQRTTAGVTARAYVTTAGAAASARITTGSGSFGYRPILIMNPETLFNPASKVYIGA